MSRLRAVLVCSAVATVCLIGRQAAQAQQRFSYVDLVNRMIDLEAPAVLPTPGETCAQWASTDRASRFDADAGRYVDWEANGDGNGFIRKQGEAMVLAEMEGPGVIWRIWSALPQQGHMKFYLDGAETPAIDMPFAHLFDARHAPFDYATLGYESGRGKNLYFPIPYQKSCKIVAEPGWGRYFQFNYTTLPEGTTVPTFSTDLPDDATAALRRVDALFRDRLGVDPAGPRDGEETIERTVALPAGKTVEAVQLNGQRAITALRVKMDFADRDDEMAALRNVVVQVTWDGQTQPAVWCPLGDLFGTAPGVNHYRSLPVGMTDEGFYSYWYMPFAKSAQIELINDGPTDRRLQLQLVHAPLTQPIEQLGRFHAKWHRDVMPVTPDRYPDWTVLRTRGRGRFCGMMLHVWNPRGGQYLPAGVGRYWWGEGDEKFFVDGETYPSTFGTGTEDYFGYAWGDGSLFARPFNNQTMTEGNAGHQSVNRWQVVDNIPFQRSFDGYLEKYFPNKVPTLYACTAIWYLSPDGADPHTSVPADQRWGYCVRPPMEYGGFTVLRRSGGVVQTQQLNRYGENVWTNNDHLWWTGGKVGDTMDLRLPVEQSGRYRVVLRLTKAVDYGIVQVSLDGNKLGEPIDLFNDGVIRADPIALGPVQLDQGDHEITFQIVGANPDAVKSYMVGIDQIILDPAP